MDEIRILKWIGLLMIMVVAALLTIVMPGLVLLIALVVFGVGGVRWLTTTDQERGDRGGTLLVFGALLLLPPIAYITAALVNIHLH